MSWSDLGSVKCNCCLVTSGVFQKFRSTKPLVVCAKKKLPAKIWIQINKQITVTSVSWFVKLFTFLLKNDEPSVPVDESSVLNRLLLRWLSSQWNRLTRRLSSNFYADKAFNVFQKLTHTPFSLADVFPRYQTIVQHVSRRWRWDFWRFSFWLHVLIDPKWRLNPRREREGARETFSADYWVYLR